MNRRGFLTSLIGGIAVGAAIRTFPFRVFSFPQEIQIVKTPLEDELNAIILKYYNPAIKKQFEAASVLWESLYPEPKLFPVSGRELQMVFRGSIEGRVE